MIFLHPCDKNMPWYYIHWIIFASLNFISILLNDVLQYNICRQICLIKWKELI